jgi:hypothetical protein
MIRHCVPPLFCGPYTAPACKAGDRLLCKVRGLVTVHGVHVAPIPWPFTQGRGGPRLIVCGDLARALRREQLAAVAHWWGISVTTAWGWRKALASGRPALPPRRWTTAEDDLVRSLTPEEAAAKTGRSLRAVYARRACLGVAKQHKWMG